MHLLKLAVRGTVLAVATTVALIPSSPAHAGSGVTTNKSCNPAKYTWHYTIASATKAPRITHIRTYAMPPSARHSVTRSASYYTRLAATVSANAEGSVKASGISRILGEASASVHMSLKASGARTSTHAVNVTDTIQNATHHNVQFVFYQGWTKAWGTYRYWGCVTDYQNGYNYGPSWVTYFPGHWQSYNIEGSGAVSCAAGTKYLGALAKAAWNLGCRA